jgi:uncharacterized protein YuzE
MGDDASINPRTVRDGHAGASYTYLCEGEIAATLEVSPDIFIDVSAVRTVIGIEVLGNGDWRDGLTALAVAGRLQVAGKPAVQVGEDIDFH